MSKRIVEAVDKLTEGAIVGDDKTLEERRQMRARNKAERKAEEEAAKREAMRGKFMPAFARAPEAEAEQDEPSVDHRPLSDAKEAAHAAPRGVGRPPLKNKKVQKSIALPEPLWEAIQKYIYICAIEKGVKFKSKSEVLEAEILKNDEILRIYEELTKD